MYKNKTTFYKNIKHILFLGLTLLVVVGTLPGCSGDKGPAGPDGEQGPKGPKGEVGPAGDDGSVILAADGKPKKSIGSIGDYYLNKKNGDLYGPKSDKGWGTPISLQGPPGKDGKDGKDGADGKDGKYGKNGKDGSQIYSGTSSPKGSKGQSGDFYLNKKSFELYGPKTKKKGWGTPINLKGTANVMYSKWFKPKEDTTAVGVLYADITANAITQDILDKGVVIVYMHYPNYSIYRLPAGPDNVPGYSYSFFFKIEKPQNLKIGVFDPNGGSPPGSFFAKYRYVIIPGGVKAKSKVKANIKDMSYQEVKKRYSIPD